MSVAASSNETPEAEALRRAQRAHEPSMEEILASIRAIIADDHEPGAPKPGPQIVYSNEATRPAPAPVETPTPTVVWTRDAEPAPIGSDPPPVANATSLMSEETEEEVATSFQILSENIAAHGREAAEQMAREMLRPMLKAWIDDNLPAMVERLVSAEIQRVTRGRR